jgi:hypothetical protein
VLTTLTVNPFTINHSRPFGDLNNGANGIATGTCTPQELFNSTNDLCGVNGMISAPNNLGDATLSLFQGGTLVGDVLGQLDDTSGGATELDMPEVSYRSPISGESVHTPSIAVAFARYNDPASLVAAENARPAFGDTPTVASIPSAAPVYLSIAPLGSSAFTVLGNANQAGGVAIPALAPGIYIDRFTVIDARGDANSTESSFVALAGPPPAPTATCKAKSSGGLKATIAAKGKGKRKHKPKKPTAITVTVTCSSADSAARVAVWLERGSAVVADGSGLVKHGAARITLSGKFSRGKYSLVELIDSGGVASETTRTLTLK